jgi:CheY-like chemotaxis protein
MGHASSEQRSPEPQSRVLPRVLIADQSAAIIERLVTILDDVALVVGRATTAQDAIRALGNVNPNLTIIDVAIPNGVDLLRRIKRHPLPVIAVVLTHSADETTRRFCLRLGAAYFLDKISEFDKVREIVIAVSQGQEKMQ